MVSLTEVQRYRFSKTEKIKGTIQMRLHNKK